MPAAAKLLNLYLVQLKSECLGFSLTTEGLEITHAFTLCSVADLWCPKVELGIIET